MKKTLRIIVAMLVFALTIGVGIANPVVARALADTVTTITAKVPSDISITEKLSISLPTIGGANAGKQTVRLTDPNRIRRDYIVGETDITADGSYFVADGQGKIRVADGRLVPGTYQIEYLAEKNGKTVVTNKYPVVVSSEKYTMSFADNSAIIPTVSYFDKNAADGAKSKEIVLPTPNVLDEEGEIVTDSGTVIDTYVELAGTGEITLADNKFTPAATGNYTIKYTLRLNSNILDTFSTNMTVKAIADFNPADIKLIADGNGFSFTFPATADLNKEVKLPKVNIIDDVTRTSQQVYTRVKIDSQAISDVLKFTPTENKIYHVSYYVEDFFGNKLTSFTKSIEVKDRTAPTIQIVNNYDPTVTDFEDSIKDASYSLPSTSYVDGLVFPAIYAHDEGTTDYNKLKGTFKRILTRKSDGKTWDIGKDKNAYEAVTDFKFPEGEFIVGEYSVRYEATDESGKVGEYLVNGTAPIIYINSTKPADNLAPTIDDIETKNTIKISEKREITMPTIVDYKEDDYESQMDINIEKHVYWFYENKPATIEEFNSMTKTELEIEEDKFELKLDENASKHNNVTIAIVAIDDYGNGNKAIDDIMFKTLEIADTSDAAAPRVATGSDELVLTGTYEQNEIVTLPTIKFFDIKDKNLEVSFSVFDKNGDAVSVNSGKVIYNNGVTDNGESGNTVSLEGFKFMTTTYGTYSIMATAKDAGGNVYTIGNTMEVKRTASTTIDKIGASSQSIELGDELDIPNGKVMVDGVVDATGTISYVVESEHSYTMRGDTLIPSEEGYYYIKYSAVASTGNTATTTKTIDVVNSAPVLKVNGAVQKTAAKDELVTLPGFTATDKHAIDMSKEATYVKVLDRFNEEVKDIKQNDDGTFSFLAKTNGQYKVIYFATDLMGKKTEETDGVTMFYIKAGDFNEPIIRITDEAKTIKKSVKKGTYTIDKTKIVVKDINYEGSEVDMSIADLEITMTHEVNGVVSVLEDDDEAISFNLESVGTYTITMTIKDAYDNTATKTFKVIVSEKAKGAGISDDALGVVLIVVSLTILGGVIIYFVVSDKKKSKRSK